MRHVDQPPRPKKYDAKDIQEPLTALAEHGRILAIMFEKDDRIEIQFWQEPNRQMLVALRRLYRDTVTHVKNTMEKRGNQEEH